MTYENAWIITCGICCIFPALMFAAGHWYARNGTRLIEALRRIKDK